MFTNVYTTAPWTLPSHASLFTGMYPTRHGSHYSPVEDKNLSSAFSEKGYFDEDNPFGYYILRLSEANKTLAEVLSENGYRTAGIVGGPFTGSVFGLAQGFDYYDEKFIDVEKDIKISLLYQAVDLFFSLRDFITQYGYSGAKRLAAHLNRATFRWLEKNHDQPFFLFINYFDAHNPYLPPPSYRVYSGGKDGDSIIKNRHSQKDVSYCTAEANLISSVVNGTHRLTPEERDIVVSLYDGEVRYLDDSLYLLFERLKALKAYDNTLIIITSDHGEAFGDHDQMDHGRSLYEELLRVPLIIKYPSAGLQQRGVIERRVSLVDIMPTILSYLEYQIPSGIDGKILSAPDRPIIAELHAKWFEIERYRRDLRAVYQGKEKYIWASNGLHELYDLAEDPGEEKNLMIEFPRRCEVMQGLLNAWIGSFKPPDTRGETVKINKSTKEKLRALGYIR